MLQKHHRNHYHPTDAQRADVIRRAKAGEKSYQIAAALKIGLRSFERHYTAEMKAAGRKTGPPIGTTFKEPTDLNSIAGKRAIRDGKPIRLPLPGTPEATAAIKALAVAQAAASARAVGLHAIAKAATEPLSPYNNSKPVNEDAFELFQDEPAPPDDDETPNYEDELADASLSIRPEKSGTIQRFIPNDPQRRLVIALVSNGLTQKQISVVLDTSVETLRHHFAPQLGEGFTRIYAAISGNLVRKALGGDKTCIIFWLKARAGWRETTRNEVTGGDGNPLDLRAVSTKDLIAAIAATERISGPAGSLAGDDEEESIN